MPGEWLTPQERWLAVRKGETPDRLPLDYRATREATAKIMARLGCIDIWENYAKLYNDPVISVARTYIGSLLAAVPSTVRPFLVRFSRRKHHEQMATFATRFLEECSSG